MLGLKRVRRQPAETPEPIPAANPAMLMPGNFALVDTSTRMAPIAARAALPRSATLEELSTEGGRGPDQPAVTKPPVANPAVSIPTAPAGGEYQVPPLELLEPLPAFPVHEHEAKINARAMLVERTLLDFGYKVRVVQIDTGPVITQFEIELEAGLRVSRIISLADDLAIAMAVPSVRIVAPIPGQDHGRDRSAQRAPRDGQAG